MTSIPSISTRRPAEPVESVSMTLRVLMFAIGLTLPIISLERYQGITRELIERIEVVDVLTLLTLSLLFLSRRIRLPAPLLIYALALLLSLVIGMGTAASETNVVTSFAALAMAALYFVLGASVARSPALVKSLMAGLAVGALGEAAIVMHDFFLPSARWFQNPAIDRVRGTFRSTAQLGNYGFSVAGMLLAFGWVYFRRPTGRAAVLAAGLAGALFVFASSRRTGMFALILWLGLYLLLGLRSVSRRAYLAVLTMALGGLLLLVVRFDEASSSHVGARFMDAVESVQSGESFTQQQLELAIEQLGDWFPLGIGAGEDHRVGSFGGASFEIHNGHLALLVELGILGAIGFYWMVLCVFTRSWDDAFGRYSRTVRLATLTFLVSAALFMLHARQQRDRAFMIFLGLAPGIAIAAAGRPRGVPVVILKRRPATQPRPNTKPDQASS